MQTALDGALGDIEHGGNLRHTEFFLVAEGEEEAKGWRQIIEDVGKGAFQRLAVHLYFDILRAYGFCIERSQIVCGVGIRAIMVAAEVVGAGKAPGIDASTLHIAVACFEKAEEGVVGGIRCRLLVASKLTEEEALQAAGIAAVQFLEGRITASADAQHQLLIGRDPHPALPVREGAECFRDIE